MVKLDLFPRRLFSYPGLSPLLNDDEDWSLSQTSSGLSISEDEQSVYIEAAVPGVDPEHIDVTYQDGYIWIRGEQQMESGDERKYYQRSNRSFSYRVAVPGDVDLGVDPEAVYKHGVMQVTLPKSKERLPKKIEVKRLDVA